MQRKKQTNKKKPVQLNITFGSLEDSVPKIYLTPVSKGVLVLLQKVMPYSFGNFTN